MSEDVRPEIAKSVSMLKAKRIRKEIFDLFKEGTTALNEWFSEFMKENYGGFEVYFKKSRKNGVLKMENGVITFEGQYIQKGSGRLVKGYETIWDGGTWLLRAGWYKGEDLNSIEDNLLNAFAPKKEGKR